MNIEQCQKPNFVEGVSIIIPAYNMKRILAECLHAATNLRWPGTVEIIVVNDGSMNRIAEIVSPFKGVRIISVPNVMAAHATNLGIQTSSYDIVASHDAKVLENDGIETSLRL